eukprot:1143209-Pelagomonas_calceolata.AAC.2
MRAANACCPCQQFQNPRLASTCTASPAVQTKWVTHAGVLWQAACETLAGPPDQRAYVTAISKLLRLSRTVAACPTTEKPALHTTCREICSASRGVPNFQLAYKLWRELFEAYKASLDGASIRAAIVNLLPISHGA